MVKRKGLILRDKKNRKFMLVRSVNDKFRIKRVR